MAALVRRGASEHGAGALPAALGAPTADAAPSSHAPHQRRCHYSRHHRERQRHGCCHGWSHWSHGWSHGCIWPACGGSVVPTRDIPGYVTRGTQYDTWSTYQGQYSVIYRGKCMGGAVLCHFQGQVYGRGSVLSLSLRDINRTIKLESIHSSWPVSHHACCVTTAAAVSCSRRTRRRCRCSRPLAAIYPGCSSRQRFMRARCASLAQMGRL